MSHRVLVVDDDADVRETLTEVLEEHGHQVFCAVNGFDALEQLRRSPHPPCVILLDLMMPVMDGRAFRVEQLKDPALSPIPVVVISAFLDATEATLEMQPAAYLKKPVSLKALVTLVRSFCAQ
jgi:CheY-like chemotaxis protein